MWLLKRELARGGEPAALDAFQCTEFDGTTLTATPAWCGTYAVDVVACVVEPAGGTFWIKALNRSVQVCGLRCRPWWPFLTNHLCRPLASWSARLFACLFCGQCSVTAITRQQLAMSAGNK